MTTSARWTIGRLLAVTVDWLARSQPDSPRLDAEILLAHVLGCPRIDLYVGFDNEVGDHDLKRFRELVTQRRDGAPVAYLLGEKDFFGRTFFVDPTVLIPRPETEFLVVAAIDWAKRNNVERFIDVGVGSGAIAITLLAQWPTSTALAVDISAEAIAVAERNAEGLGVRDRLTLLTSDLFEAVPSGAPVDMVISNPPYVARDEWDSLDPGVREREPRLALWGGEGGLEVIERLIEQSRHYLKPGGSLLMEIGAGQESATRELLARDGGWSPLPTRRDGAGIPRVVGATRNSVTEQ